MKKIFAIILVIYSTLFYIQNQNHSKENTYSNNVQTKNKHKIDSNNVSRSYENIFYKRNSVKKKSNTNNDSSSNNNTSIIISSFLLTTFVLAILIALLLTITFKVVVQTKCKKCKSINYKLLKCSISDKCNKKIPDFEPETKTESFWKTGYKHHETIISREFYISSSNCITADVENIEDISKKECDNLHEENISKIKHSENNIKLAVVYNEKKDIHISTSKIPWVIKKNIVTINKCRHCFIDPDEPHIAVNISSKSMSELDFIYLVLNDLTIFTKCSDANDLSNLSEKVINRIQDIQEMRSLLIRCNNYWNKILFLEALQNMTLRSLLENEMLRNNLERLNDIINPMPIEAITSDINYINIEPNFFPILSSFNNLSEKELNLEDILSNCVINLPEQQFLLELNEYFENSILLHDRQYALLQSIPINSKIIPEEMIRDCNSIRFIVEQIFVMLIHNNTFNLFLCNQLCIDFIFNLMYYYNTLTWEIVVSESNDIIKFFISIDDSNFMLTYCYFNNFNSTFDTKTFSVMNPIKDNPIYNLSLQANSFKFLALSI